MKIREFTTTLILLAFGLGVTQLQAQQEGIYQLQMDLAFLSSDLMEGRETGKTGERLAARYIIDRMKALGVGQAPGMDSYLQAFMARYRPNPHEPANYESREAKNVIGYIDNGADRTIVIGAHYDHLGYGHFGSRFFGDPEIHNGADDNASGTSALLRIAEKLKSSKEASLKQSNYLFAFFSGEEMGLLGSKHFVANMPVSKDQVWLMLNYDMVGRLDSNRTLIVNGTGTAVGDEWEAHLSSANQLLHLSHGDSLMLKFTKSGIGASDHTSFYLDSIPAVHFFTGAHEEYHRPSDDAHLIDYEGIADISDYSVWLLYQLNQNGQMAYQETKDEDQGRAASSFKVSMGIMPDYAYNGKGLKIDGVRSDRPASNAGIQKGDVVIQMGEHKIKDIFAYMNALGKFESGQTIDVVVLRKDEEVKVKLTFD